MEASSFQILGRVPCPRRAQSRVRRAGREATALQQGPDVLGGKTESQDAPGAGEGGTHAGPHVDELTTPQGLQTS